MVLSKIKSKPKLCFADDVFNWLVVVLIFVLIASRFWWSRMSLVLLLSSLSLTRNDFKAAFNSSILFP
ncbi:hypothetical protein [Mycoplasmopsis cynos]|uniref:hypothetical protein n=1 Tax=Mycoplasmopsis cynos TaxID=171284 RepID=UPI00220DB896|nr:hypothetical protein [Mycoplasmopsis cynos]UWV77389.1 hypothetical protein NW070_00080 [Mycoplasmopsis cynos]